jgi:hypothetical protein
MRLKTLSFAFFAVWPMTNAASACSFAPDERSPSEIRANSNAVAVDRQCRTINAGVYDHLSLGPATNLGHGRVQQVLDGSDQSRVLLADCNTREVTMLEGPVTHVQEGDFCDPPNVTHADLSGENAIMSLAVGTNLHELVDLATANGAVEQNPNEIFFTFWIEAGSKRRNVSAKDRFDLLCGCKIFYPESAGARN